MNPPENISDRIEREREAWSKYPFSEENLPKEVVKEEETQIPTTPPPPPKAVGPIVDGISVIPEVKAVNNPALAAQVPDVKKEKVKLRSQKSRRKRK
jgi:hypothetical protein